MVLGIHTAWFSFPGMNVERFDPYASSIGGNVKLVHNREKRVHNSKFASRDSFRIPIIVAVVLALFV